MAHTQSQNDKPMLAQSSGAIAPSLDISNADLEKRFGSSTISTTIVRDDYLQVRVTPHPLNPSLCIPSVHYSIDRRDVFNIFRKLNLGYIDFIHMARNKRDNTSAFAPVYIHFLYWFDNEESQKVRERVNEGKNFKVFYDDAHPNRFWKVLKSDLSKPLPNLARIEKGLKLFFCPRMNEDGTEEETPDNNETEGTCPLVETRTMSLVIPRIRKGYTTEHIRFVLEQIDLFERIDRIDLIMPKKDSPLYTKPYMTAYVHVVFLNTPFANYLREYLAEHKTHQAEIAHEVAPKHWSWVLKRSDLAKPPTKTSAPDTTPTSPDTKIADMPTIQM